MDCTQINFSLSFNAVSSADDMVISVPCQKFDLSASIFLAPENASCTFGSLFFSLQSSLESAIFCVREGFENFAATVHCVSRKIFGKVRSMWRERIAPKCACKLFKRPAVTVMRT